MRRTKDVLITLFHISPILLLQSEYIQWKWNVDNYFFFFQITFFSSRLQVLESFKIMDYSLLVAIHNLDQAEREAVSS